MYPKEHPQSRDKELAGRSKKMGHLEIGTFDALSLEQAMHFRRCKNDAPGSQMASTHADELAGTNKISLVGGYCADGQFGQKIETQQVPQGTTILTLWVIVKRIDAYARRAKLEACKPGIQHQLGQTLRNDHLIRNRPGDVLAPRCSPKVDAQVTNLDGT
jgi:hypothetical protein